MGEIESSKSFISLTFNLDTCIGWLIHYYSFGSSICFALGKETLFLLQMSFAKSQEKHCMFLQTWCHQVAIASNFSVSNIFSRAPQIKFNLWTSLTTLEAPHFKKIKIQKNICTSGEPLKNVMFRSA